jgi:hypothetical protein
MGDDAVERRLRREVTGPAHIGRQATGALPVGVLLASIDGVRGGRSCVVVRPVVRGILDDRIVGDAKLIQKLEKIPDMHVVLDHSVGKCSSAPSPW